MTLSTTPCGASRERVAVGEPEEWVSLAEVARRVGISGARIHELRQTDPGFPPYRQVGRAMITSWEVARRYFESRDRRPGRKGWARARRDSGVAASVSPDNMAPQGQAGGEVQPRLSTMPSRSQRLDRIYVEREAVQALRAAVPSLIGEAGVVLRESQIAAALITIGLAHRDELVARLRKSSSKR